MNIDELQSLVCHATQTLAAVNANVKELLDSEAPDAVKKSVLIEYLGIYYVEIEYMRDQLAKQIAAEKPKKFKRFRK